ncbi:MAG: acyl-CoA dehydrogenase family protein [Planctomycetes bacterium]|nr:acyl-CoA dehydrogenase family protein [Planctomycetota bacterium]
MDFTLTPPQEAIRTQAREFADGELVPNAPRIDRQKEFPHANLRKLAALGWLGVLVPRDLGGAGLDNLTLALIGEQINRGCASTGVTWSVHNSLVCSPLIRHGNADQQRRYLPPLARGEILGAYALTEPGSGSDAAAMVSTARRDGDFYVLNGSKAFITTGGNAGLYIVFARTHPDPSLKAKAISAFLVEATYPGCKPGPSDAKMGIRGSSTVTLYLEDCRVPAANRLGEEGKGFHIAMDTLDGGRIGIATQALGIGQAALDAAVAWMRESAGDPAIYESQPNQWRVAEAATELDAARLLVWRAALLRDLKQPHTPQAAMAKLFASTSTNRIVRDALALRGEAAIIGDTPFERFFRDARITELYEGTSEIQKIVIARSLLKP